MQLTMKNLEVKPLGDFLYNLALKGKESRMRSRFVQLLEKHLEQISVEREQLLKEFSIKNDKGFPLTDVDVSGKEFYMLTDKVAFNKELTTLMSEIFVIDVTPSNEEMIETVKNVVLNNEQEFSGVEAELYNRFCEIFEQFDNA